MKGKSVISFIVPTIIVILGVGKLLNSFNIVPGVNWLFTLGLACAGVLTLIMGGIDKLTVVVGSLLMVTSVCTFLKQSGTIESSRQVPILIIALGFLLLLVHVLKLPPPRIPK